MKTILLALLTFSTLISHAQSPLTPAPRAFEKRWITDQSYRMQWYAIRDTGRTLMGEVSTRIEKGQKTLTIVTKVAMKNSKIPWMDSTVALLADLSPVRHASYNAQRDMVLNFGKTVTGYYLNKSNGTTTSISESPKGTYFDSNLYPMLICWLPLKEHLNQELSIYGYNPAGKIGVIRAWVKNVASGTYTSSASGDIKVWIVSVADEISSGQTTMTYYIAKSDRKLWKQEITAGARKMVMQRIE